RSGVVLVPPAVVAGFDDVAMMGQPIQQGGGHLRISQPDAGVHATGSTR
ncbi:MAG: hypothetical protein QOF70_2130, partial [Acetobacteraceae bacterium]|nr:hypothetical protein [Acetobacteraceae bacterium]